MRRIVGFLVSFESLWALACVVASGLSAGVWVLVPEVVWVALICTTTVIIGVIPWGFRFYQWRQRRKQPPRTVLGYLIDTFAQSQRHDRDA